MPISLPPEASHEHLKKQAKQLLKACHRQQSEAVRRIIASHPNYLLGLSEPTAVRLQEAQVVVAREYGFSSWKQLLDTVSLRSEKGKDVDVAGLLILTNGMHTIGRMEEAGIQGEKEEWLEILHQGPVPFTESKFELNQVRARHLESIGWASYDGAMAGFKRRERALEDSSQYHALQLWFEHDLYDQLQLVQLLDYLADKPDWLVKTQLVQFNEFLGRVSQTALAEGVHQATALTAEQLELAQAIWSAFRQSEPFKLGDLLECDSSALPYVRSAMLRVCQEFPDSVSGLGRTERQILECLEPGPSSLLNLFRCNQAKEAAAYLGDSGFMIILERLTQGVCPLIEWQLGDAVLLPANLSHPHARRDAAVQLSTAGRAALAGEHDWLKNLPVPYWIGGSRIADQSSSRWNHAAGTFVKD